MDRDQLIELLIRDQLEKLHVGQHSRRYLEVVEREFRALGALSDEDLEEELMRRGIAAGLESDDGPVDEPDDDEEEDDEEVYAMLRDQLPSDDDWAPSFR